MVLGSSQSGVSAHCDAVQRGCFIEGLLVINERVELSAVLKVTSQVTAGLSVRETDLGFHCSWSSATKISNTDQQIHNFSVKVLRSILLQLRM